MPLENLIDLIAKVAAKRAAREGEHEEDTPDAVVMVWRTIRARVRNACHKSASVLDFMTGWTRGGRARRMPGLVPMVRSE